jgi:hypothetical protein
MNEQALIDTAETTAIDKMSNSDDVVMKSCHLENLHKDSSLLIDIKAAVFNYKPLIIILLFCCVLTTARNNIATLPSQTLMHMWMGYFFIFLSMFKFFDMRGFVGGFSTYDLITKQFRFYGYLYPFIELGLGFSYLSEFQLFWANWVTIIVMTISGIGVLNSIILGRKTKCACLGTVLKVPLSTVSILENFGMGIMAIYALLHSVNL